jgi:hypothetical protein
MRDGELDYRDILANPDIAVVYICTTPEYTHFPIARDCLRAGKHVLLEKPIAVESTHDLDFGFWLLEPAKPVRVYSQGAYG